MRGMLAFIFKNEEDANNARNRMRSFPAHCSAAMKASGLFSRILADRPAFLADY
jgi:hypothetical protein